MIHPIAIHYYAQLKQSPNNCIGRYDLYKCEGKKIMALIHTMVREPNKGKETITVYKNKKGELALSNSSLGKLYPENQNAKHISRLAGTDINEANIRLYGDIQFSNNPILVDFDFNPDTKERLLKIMVFSGGDEEALSLYQKRESGTIKESVSDNNINFAFRNCTK